MKRAPLLLFLAGVIGGMMFLSACTSETTTSIAASTTTTPTGAAPTGTTGTTASMASSTSTGDFTTPTDSTSTTGSTSTATSTTPTMSSTFTAELSGAEVVPAVDTPATGTATFTIEADGSKAHFKLSLNNITDVIASRVHEGKPGENGRGLLILYPGPTLNGPFTGVLAAGNFNASALIGSLTGKTLADFAILLQSGRAYVNVGTVQNPDGEIRGQIH
jgi:hypothetical protein